MAIVKYLGGTYRTYGELPAVGSRAPDFSLVNTELQDVTLANFMANRKIFNIFVSIDRPVCSKSVITFDRLVAPYDDVVALMVSYDLPFAHKRLQEQHHLEHVVGLSAIRHAGFGENYGVQIMDGPLAGMFARAVVVIDENNTVVHTEHLEDISIEPNYEAAFRARGIDVPEE